MAGAIEPSTWLRLALTVAVLFTSSNGAPSDLKEPYHGQNDPHITPSDDWKENVRGHEAVKDLGHIDIAPDWKDSTHISPLPVKKGWRSNQGDSHASQVGVIRGLSPVVMGQGKIHIVPDSYGHQYPVGRGEESSSEEDKDSGSKDSGSNSNSDCDSKDCDLSYSGSDSKSSSESRSKEIGSKERRERSKGNGWRETRHRSKHSKEESHKDYHHGPYKHH